MANSESVWKKWLGYVPGIAAAAVLAILAKLIEKIIPGDIVGASFIALLIGILLNPWISKVKVLSPGIGFTSGKVLKLSIVVMGATYSFAKMLEAGWRGLVAVLCTLFVALIIGALVGKLFKIDWKLSSLLNVGTAICGGSAISAVAPAIDAEDEDIAYSISVTFLFDLFLILLFPIFGRLFNMSDMGFGLWSGAAIGDTSSVVAAGYAYSEAAGSTAVVVKMVRTLFIIPIVLVFSLISRRKAKAGQEKVNLKSTIPWFILFFVILVAVNSLGWIPSSVSAQCKTISKFLMIMALGAVGLKTSFKSLVKIGWKPIAHKILVTLGVILVAFLMQGILA